MYTVKIITLLLIFQYFSISVLLANEYQAKLKWSNVTNLSFRVNGTISNVFVSAGNRVVKDTKLLILDQREFVENVSLTNSLRTTGKSGLNESKRELDRAVELYDRTVLSEHELQIVKNNYILSESSYFSNNINWIKAKRDLEFSSLSAPFDAVILSISAKQYEFVNNTLLVVPNITIADARKIEAHFVVKSELLKNFKIGNPAKVIIDGTIFNGVIFFPSLLADNHLYPIAIKINMPKFDIRANQDVIVKID